MLVPSLLLHVATAAIPAHRPYGANYTCHPHEPTPRPPALRTDDGYVPLPPQPPLQSLPPLVRPALNRGAILQLWGHSQAVAMRDATVPAALKAAYAFDLVTMIPLDAHNSMCSTESGSQQCGKADHMTEAQFAAGVRAFAEANYSVIFYTSIMHDGHSPSWENGSVSAAHPEMSQRKEDGSCAKDYGQCNLSPSSAVNLTLERTAKTVMAFPKAVAGVMIDNAFWQGITGFEAAAVAGFKADVAQRFGSEHKKFFGSLEIKPPTAAVRNSSGAAEQALFGAWKVWREREYGAAVEAFRARLHPLGVAVLANVDFFPEDWTRGSCEVLGHVDAVVSESHDSSASSMALKYSLGLGLTPGRPNLNYIAVFNQSCQSHFRGDGAKCPMKQRDLVRGMVVTAFASMSRPWLVAWSLSMLIDAPASPEQNASATELSKLMRFRAENFDELFNFAGRSADGAANDHAASVAVLASWRYNGQAEGGAAGKADVRPPAAALRAMGVDYRFETARTVDDFNSLGPSSTLRVLLCDEDSALDAATAAKVGAWVRAGGELWAARGRCATVDELRRPYDEPLLEAEITKHGVGKGRAMFVNASTAPSNTSGCSKCPRGKNAYGNSEVGSFCCSGPILGGKDCSCPAFDPASLPCVCCLCPGSSKGCQGNKRCGTNSKNSTACHQDGNGKSPLETSAAWIVAMQKLSQIVAPRTSAHPKTTSWQTTSWHAAGKGKPALLTHFENISQTGGASEYGDLVLQLALPPSMVALQGLGASLRSPYEEGPRAALPLSHDGAFVEVTVAAPPAYGVVVIEG